MGRQGSPGLGRVTTTRRVLGRLAPVGRGRKTLGLASHRSHAGAGPSPVRGAVPRGRDTLQTPAAARPRAPIIIGTRSAHGTPPPAPRHLTCAAPAAPVPPGASAQAPSTQVFKAAANFLGYKPVATDTIFAPSDAVRATGCAREAAGGHGAGAGTQHARWHTRGRLGGVARAAGAALWEPAKRPTSPCRAPQPHGTRSPPRPFPKNHRPPARPARRWPCLSQPPADPPPRPHPPPPTPPAPARPSPRLPTRGASRTPRSCSPRRTPT